MSTPGPDGPLVLSLRGVSKAFGAVQALRDVSFDCRAGEIHALARKTLTPDEAGA